MYENYGRAPPEGTLHSETATSRVEIELAIWSAGHEFPADREWLTPLLPVSLFSCFRLSRERLE